MHCHVFSAVLWKDYLGINLSSPAQLPSSNNSYIPDAYLYSTGLKPMSIPAHFLCLSTSTAQHCLVQRHKRGHGLTWVLCNIIINIINHNIDTMSSYNPWIVIHTTFLLQKVQYSTVSVIKKSLYTCIAIIMSPNLARELRGARAVRLISILSMSQGTSKQHKNPSWELRMPASRGGQLPETVCHQIPS